VIGGGNSACDIAVEAARSAVASHISLRRGYWFLPKTAFGVPTVELMQPWMPMSMQRALVKAMVRVVVGRYEDYGLPRPDHEPFERHPTINSELLHFIRHGRITSHSDIAYWDGDGAVFTDGTRAPIDLVVAATGFNVSFPFLDPDVLKWNGDLPVLLGGLVPPNRKNIYFFGLGQPRYGAGPLISAGAELLCTMVATQSRLQHPLGALLERMGQKPPETLLQDPHRILRQMKVAHRILPRLPMLEGLLMRRRRGAHDRSEIVASKQVSAE
jgi:cation diffusion facilitator CzcD-associated flavoprotein CzcO